MQQICTPSFRQAGRQPVHSSRKIHTHACTWLDKQIVETLCGVDFGLHIIKDFEERLAVVLVGGEVVMLEFVLDDVQRVVLLQMQLLPHLGLDGGSDI